MRRDPSAGKRIVRTWFPSSLLVVLSLLLYYASLQERDLPALSSMSSLTFWSSLSLLVFPRLKFDRRSSFLIPFFAYLLYHSLLYGLVLGLAEPGGLPYVGSIGKLSFGYGYAIPPSNPIYFPIWVSQTPALWVFMGVYEADVTPFSLFVGLTLATLMGLNVSNLVSLNGLRKSLRLGKEVVVIPGVGLVSGTSCCTALPSILLYSIALSVPGLADPILGILRSTPYFLVIYYGLPLFSILLLYFNLGLIARTSRACDRYKSKFG